MLVGRAEERARIRRLLAAARRGQSTALVIHGEAGIGKSALLESAVRSARGMTLLRTRGVESEAELAYAGLLTLLQPVLGLLSTLPQAQARALAGALGLGAARTLDPLAVCGATLALLAAASEREPVLIVVDDAHWLDEGSARAVGFVGRRLAHERVAMLIALREGEDSRFAVEAIERMALAGLDLDASRDLLGDRCADSVIRQLVAATSGNPLALLEVVGALSPGQRAGAEALADPVPVGPGLERAFGRRLASLPERTYRAVLLAAVAGPRDDVLSLAPAWSCLEVSVADLAPAERAGLVAVEDGVVRFRHPLVRAAAYAGASAPDQRAAHAALATTLDAESEADERAWHVAFAAAQPDEAAATLLEEVGVRATGRSRDGALRALERAAALTPDPIKRSRRLLAAASAASEAGSWDEARRLLAGVDVAADGVEPDEHLFLSAMVAARSDPGEGAAEQLEDVARRLADRDPDRTAEVLVNAALVWSANAQRQRALAAAERAAGLPFRRGGKTELAVELALGDTAGWLGRSEEAAHHWQRAAQIVDDEDPEQLQMAGEALFSAGDDASAQRLLRRAEAVAREQGALDALTMALLNLGLSQTRSGDIVLAHADAIDCVQLMQACGHRSDQAGAIGNVAWIEAILGREAECRAHVAEARVLLAALGAHAPYGASPIGLLELSRGRPDLAIEPFEETLSVGDFRLDAEPIAPRPILPSLVEALARVDRHEEALRALGDRVDMARSTGRADAIAPLLRAQSMVEADEDLFREALVWHDRWSNRFERARTELCYGEYLRRSKRRAEARVLLRASVAGFETVGARLWATRARAELAVTGERARRRDPSTLDELTPQELTVARLVATGLTNREVAQRLFLSPKTIETHLAHVFRKTGVRTRAELAHRFRDSPDSIAAPAS